MIYTLLISSAVAVLISGCIATSLENWVTLSSSIWRLYNLTKGHTFSISPLLN